MTTSRLEPCLRGQSLGFGTPVAAGPGSVPLRLPAAIRLGHTRRWKRTHTRHGPAQNATGPSVTDRFSNQNAGRGPGVRPYAPGV